MMAKMSRLVSDRPSPVTVRTPNFTLRDLRLERRDRVLVERKQDDAAPLLAEVVEVEDYVVRLSAVHAGGSLKAGLDELQIPPLQRAERRSRSPSGVDTPGAGPHCGAMAMAVGADELASVDLLNDAAEPIALVNQHGDLVHLRLDVIEFEHQRILDPAVVAGPGQ
jgi:hypothetical protein